MIGATEIKSPKFLVKHPLDSISPCLHHYVMKFNDAPWWESKEEKEEILLPYIEQLEETYDPEKEDGRGYLCADRAFHVFAPFWLEKSSDIEVSKWATILKNLPEITDKESALLAKKIVLAVKVNLINVQYSVTAAKARIYASIYANGNSVNSADAAITTAYGNSPYKIDSQKEARKIMREEAIKLLKDLINFP